MRLWQGKAEVFEEIRGDGSSDFIGVWAYSRIRAVMKTEFSLRTSSLISLNFPHLLPK